MAHPYSAQSLGSTSDVENDYSDGGFSSSDYQQRSLYRPVAHNDNSQQLAAVSQARVTNFDSRQSSTHNVTPSGDSNYSPVVYAPRDPSIGVPPGSYFAAYPPTSASMYRGRSDSANSAASADSPSQPAPVTAPSGSGAPPPGPVSNHHSASHPRPTRPSSRKALTAALELAKSAVQLDSSNDNPHAAVLAYAKSVKLLGEVMERVMRGEDTASSSTAAAGANGHVNPAGADAEDRRRGSRRRSVVAKEEEVRRLKAIQPSPEPSQQLFQHAPSTRSTASSIQSPASHPQSLTRQSSASSVSGLSGVSSTASSSSAASNVYSSLSTGSNFSQTNLSSFPGTQPAASGANLSAPFATRPRGNSNAHGRTLSNAERLVVVNEEKEEDEGTIRGLALSTDAPAPQEFKYRSRSSSMVSLKDRDRARGQILGTGALPPLPTNIPAAASSVTTPATVAPLNLKRPTPPPPETQTSESAVGSTPNLATLGPRNTSRTRGNSVGSATTHTSEEYSSSVGSSSTPVATMPYTAGGAPPPSSAPIIIPGAIGINSDGPVRINANPSTGTISQRRIKNATTGSSIPSPPPNNVNAAVNKLT
ncbi:hypothetical protein FRC17_004315, partial [Serendipita sp. 399]